MRRDRLLAAAAVQAGHFELLERRELFSGSMAAAALLPAIRPAAVHVEAVRTVHAAATLGGTGVTAEYFADSGLARPVLARVDPSVNFAGAKGIATSLKSAGGARWTGQIAVPATGAYTFSVQAAGGVVLSIDGKQLISSPGSAKAVRSNTPITLAAGQKYAFVMQYTKAAGANPSVKLFYATGKQKQQVVPQGMLFPAATLPTLPATSAGLAGSYYLGNDFQQLLMTRVDPTIDFNFGTSSPNAVIPTHRPFSIRWTGQITPAKSDNYTFDAVADDGIRVYVGGQLVVDDFTQHAATPSSGKIVLNAGQHYDLRVEYFQNGKGVGQVRLNMAGSDGRSQVLSSSLLSSTPAATAGTLSVVPTTSTNVTLTWTGSGTATGYTVYRSADNGTTYAAVATVAAGVVAYVDVNLTANTTYLYRVTPFGSADTSTPSNVASVTTLTVTPAAVTVVVNSATDLNLSWADVAGEVGFVVLESTDGGHTFAAAGRTPQGTTTYHLTGLLPGTTYAFEVEAVNVAGNPSAPTAPTVTVTPTLAPSAVTAVGASVASVQLTWADVTNEGGFVVLRGTSADGPFAAIGTTAGGVTTYTDADLSAGFTYYYRVQARAAVDVTVVSAPSATVTAGTVTLAPASVSAATFGSAEIDLAWADVAGAAGFRVLESTDGGQTFAAAGTTGAGTTSLAVTGLAAGTAYAFEVQAVNVGGQYSAPSPVGSATTTTAAPAGVAATGASNTSVVVSWSVAAGATGYAVDRSPDGQTAWAQVTATAGHDAATYTDAGLAGGTTYYYRVRGLDAGGASVASAVATGLTAPDAPANPNAAGASPSQSQVAWDPSTGSDQYVVQRSPDGTNDWQTVSTTPATAPATAPGGIAPAVGPAGQLLATLTNAAASTKYFYRVLAVNATGTSAPSAVVSNVTAPLQKYAVPTTLYGATADGTLYSVANLLTTATAVPVGQILPGGHSIRRSPLNGLLYYTVDTPTPKAYTWDPTTGNTAVFGNSLPGIKFGAFDAAGNAYLADATGNLFKYVPGTTAAAPIGQLRTAAGTAVTPGVGNLAVNGQGVLYMASNATIYTVNAATAVVTPIATLAAGNVTISFGNNNLIVATTPFGSMLTLDPNTLAPTLMNNAVPSFNSLAADPRFENLTISATASTVVPGTPGSYRVSVANTGLATEPGPVTVTATLPAGTTFTGVTGTGWTGTAAGSTVTLTYAGTLAPATTAPPATISFGISTAATGNLVASFNVAGNLFDTNTLTETSSLTSVLGLLPH